MWDVHKYMTSPQSDKVEKKKPSLTGLGRSNDTIDGEELSYTANTCL
jgi:hypothetical protein